MQTITVEELKARLDAGDFVHLLDVREPFENADFNIGGSLVPLTNIQFLQLEGIESWKDDEVVVYCRSGNRSGQACMILEAQGFKNVKNLTGGMLKWREAFV